MKRSIPPFCRKCWKPRAQCRWGKDGDSYCLDCRSLLQKSRDKQRKDSGLCRCGRKTIDRHKSCVECSGQEAKKIVFDHYGRRCTCCEDFFIDAFLTLNHKNNDGAAHRKIIGSRIYPWAIRNGFPDFLETNCWNCNCGRRVKGGVCPHEQNRMDSAVPVLS